MCKITKMLNYIVRDGAITEYNTRNLRIFEALFRLSSEVQAGLAQWESIHLQLDVLRGQILHSRIG